jgi:hypothetical protein
MAEPPVSEEIAAALGRFFSGGLGPTHSALTGVFHGTLTNYTYPAAIRI